MEDDKTVSKEKRRLTDIGKIKEFNEAIKKLTINDELEFKEKV